MNESMNQYNQLKKRYDEVMMLIKKLKNRYTDKLPTQSPMDETEINKHIKIMTKGIVKYEEYVNEKKKLYKKIDEIKSEILLNDPNYQIIECHDEKIVNIKRYINQLDQVRGDLHNRRIVLNDQIIDLDKKQNKIKLSKMTIVELEETLKLVTKKMIPLNKLINSQGSIMDVLTYILESTKKLEKPNVLSLIETLGYENLKPYNKSFEFDKKIVKQYLTKLGIKTTCNYKFKLEIESLRQSTNNL